MNNINNLRIVFLGTPDFAVESLKSIVENGYNVVGVVTMPDKPAGRGKKIAQSPVKEYALSKGLHLMQPQNLKNPEFVEELRSLQADLFVVIAFRMLPEIVWQMPPLGTFNLHASLLPNYRGAAPINRAIMNGDVKTGVTTFFLKHEIDTGDIIDQVAIEIGPDENVGSVHDRLMYLGAELTLKTIKSISEGTLTATPQHMLAGSENPLPAPKIFKDDCRIDWNSPANTIHNHVRGLSPYPGAWTTLGDENPQTQLKIFATKRTGRTTTLQPGTLEHDRKHLFVACGDGSMLEIMELQLQGKKRMSADDFMRGLKSQLSALH